MNAGSQDIYYVYDGLGSVSMLTNLVGISLGSYTYDVFGSTRSQMGLVNNNSFLFTGRQLDNETNLYYYRNRFYNPTLGRFITKDPIGLGGGVNEYSYVRSNPIRYIDPYGLKQNELLTLFDPTHIPFTNYCGWFTSGPGEPTSPLDACCKAHDACLEKSGKSCLNLFSGEVRKCHSELRNCVAGLFN